MAEKAKFDRARFWRYCVRTFCEARARSAKKDIPFSIDANFIDQLLVDQEWRCAVSGMPLNPPGSAGWVDDVPLGGTKRKLQKDPFGPSLDRIVPSVGYVPGNLRIVSNMVNAAIGEWGLDNFLKVSVAMAERLKNTKHGTLTPRLRKNV